MPFSLQTLRPVVLVLLLYLAGLGSAAQFAKISVAFAEVRALYPEAGTEVGLLLSIISFLGIAFGLFAGLIVDRLGFRRLLFFALILGGVISLYQATLPSFWPMLFSRLFEGISHLIIVVAAPTLIAQSSSDRFRGWAMTLWSTFFGVAFALAAWFGLPLVQAQGLSSIFLAHGIYMLLVLILLSFFLRQPLPRHQVPTPLGLVDILRQHWVAYRSPFISAPGFGWLFYTFTFVSLVTILPDLVPPEDRSFVAGSMPLASIAVSLLVVGTLLRFIPAVHIVLVGFVLAIAAIMLIWLRVDVTQVAILLFAVLGLVQGGSFAAVPQLNKDVESQARANGAMAQMGNLGNTLGTPVCLAILSFAGLNGLIVTIIGFYVIGVTVHLVQAKRRRSAENHLRTGA